MLSTTRFQNLFGATIFVSMARFYISIDWLFSYFILLRIEIGGCGERHQ